jgi:hypothetical protein
VLPLLREAAFVITKHSKVAGSRPRKEYALTEKGEALRLPFLAMWQWSEYWVGQGRTPPMKLSRKSDGTAIHIAFVDEFGCVVPPDDLTARFEEWATLPTDHAEEFGS